MAWDKNDDVLGKIFDFIFAQEKKPPDKRKPVDATGISGEKEIIDAVAAVLENPAAFNVSNMADEYSDAVNLKIAELRFSEDNIKKLELGTSNLAEIITDPVAFAKKIRDTNKAIRKSMRAKYLGAQAAEFAVSSYLMKKGFSKELRDIIKNDVRFRDSIKELYEFSDYKEAEGYAQAVARPPMLSGADKEYLNARQAKLVGKMSISEADWDGLSERQQNTLTKAIIEGNSTKISDFLNTNFGTQKAQKALKRLGYNSKKGYHELETANLKRESRVIEKTHFINGRWDSEAAELMYERNMLASGFIEYSPTFNFIAGRKTFDILNNSNKYANNLRTQINDIKNDLRSARRSGNTNLQRVLTEKLKYAQNTQRALNQVRIFGNIGMVEGYFNSIKDYWNLPSIIKGDFFKSTKNQFACPTSKLEFQLERKNSRGQNQKYTISEFMVPQYYVGKSARWPVKSYQEFWTRMYYLTPGSIFRTFLYNGEGFAWQAYNQSKKIKDFLNGANIPGLKLDSFWVNAEYRKDIFYRGIVTNPELLKMLQRYDRFGSLTKMFSAMYRVQNRFLEFMNDKFIKGFREKVYQLIIKSKIFSKLKDGSVALGLLKQWAKNGSMRNLIKGLSQGLAEVLGITVTPILSFIIGTVVGWVAEGLYNLAVPLFGMVIYSILGIIGVFILIAGGLRANTINYNISASTPPGDVGYCDASNSGFETDEFWGTEIEVPPPTDSSCPVDDTVYVCTQGYTNTQCSHSGMTAKKPVDIDGAGANIKYFYAPKYCDTSTCTATTIINPGRCGDGNYVGQWVKFDDGNGNVFTLGHTKFIPPSNGRNYSAGEPVAYVYQTAAELIADDPEQRTSGTSFACWTGSHIHLLISHNGTPIDPLKFLYEMGCVNGPASESQCPSCTP